VRDRHLSSRFFFRDRLVCIAPPGEAPTAKAIRPRDLEGRQLFLYDRGGSIRRAVDAWLDAADRKRIRIGDIGSAEAQTAFVRAGLGWSIVSEVTARDAAAAGRIDLRLLAPPLSRDLVLVWRADRATRPVIAAALDVFSGHAASP
jgi:DNA-binding transcriptional LysR family regulator